VIKLDRPLATIGTDCKDSGSDGEDAVGRSVTYVSGMTDGKFRILRTRF
jgi:hypothetical protein